MPLQQFITIANSAPQQPPSPATMSSSPKRVVTTTSKSPLSWTTALRIPTVQPKTLFKFTTVTTASTTKTACRVPCRQEPHDIQPLFSEKTCGLFNTVESTVTPEIDKFDLDMDEANINFEPFLTNFDFNSVVEQSSPLNQSSTPSSSQLTLQSSPITAAAIPAAAATAAASNTIIPKKTFHQKLNEANLSIKIVKPNIDNITVAAAAATAASAVAQMTSNNTTLEGMMSPSFGFDYDNAEMSKLFTPGTEKLCFDLIDSIATSDILDPVLEEEEEPSASSPPDVLSLLKQQQSVASARVATEEELIACLGIDACDLQTMIADSTSPPVVAAPVVAPATVATSSIAAPLAAFTPLPPLPPAAPQHGDHAYSSSRTVAEKRRRLSSTASALDEFAAPPSSVLSTTSTNLDTSDEMNSSMTMPSTSGIAGGKRQRTKGVYRARDVTNESEMQNYRERRQKNNISSKISRANKRNFYLEMDAKCEHVENENMKFARKIVKLELLNQLMKDYLKNAFSANLK